MPILAKFMNFCDFYDFREASTTAFLRISKIPMVNFQIHSFSFYLFKNFRFLVTVTQICALKFESRV